MYSFRTWSVQFVVDVLVASVPGHKWKEEVQPGIKANVLIIYRENA